MLNIEQFTGGLLATNAYLAAADRGAPPVLIDAPAGVAGWLSASGVEPAVLLLTHQHFDHLQGAAEVVRAFGCPVMAWSAFDRGLTLEDEFGGFSGLSLEIEPIAVDEVLEGREALEAGGIRFELAHVPGHSPDSVCFLHRDAGVVFGGDVLMQGGIGRWDFPGGDGELLVAGIRRSLLCLPDAIRVFPGHGPPTTVGAERASNPFLV